MKTIVEQQLLLDEINGYVRWSLLHGAVELQLFDHLRDWAGAGEVAARLDADQRRTALLLDGLTACGYLRKFCGQYMNAATTDRYLVSDADLYQGRVFMALSRLRLQGLDRLPELLRGEDRRTLRLEAEDLWAQAAEHLADFQKLIAPRIASLVSALPNADRFRRLLDLGGGPGGVGLGLLQAFPELEGTLFDLPAVIEQARRQAAAMQLAQRLQFLAGDYNRDDLGAGYDLVVAGRSLYYADDRGRLLAKIAAAMNSGGVLLCLHEGLCNERTRPAEVVLSRIGVALRGSDVSFERGELESGLLAAGLRIQCVYNLDELGGNADLIVGVKP